MQTRAKKIVSFRVEGDNTWLSLPEREVSFTSGREPFLYQVMESEEAVGQAMFDELVAYAGEKAGDITIILLGGRGAQAMYRVINRRAVNGEIDDLLARLNVFTQDALAPLPMNSSLSFVRDFERLLGPEFFTKIKSFTPMLTEEADLNDALADHVEKIESLGGIDIFFLGLGPEAEAASHLCYIKPGCGARLTDQAGIVPISESILEHHISKFKAGGSEVSADDEAQCRNASHIMTLGPAAILGARRIVQSIVDASTAPGKKASFRRLLDTELSEEPAALAKQVDENPGLLVRLHNDVHCYVLPDLLA
jgi:6-phosphogluconolactonase/glucosamine-6-phosphate isomerase/deaminase